MDSEAPRDIGRDSGGRLPYPPAVAFSVGLLGSAVLFDGVALLGGGATMSVVAYRMLAAGLIGAAALAAFGWWRSRCGGAAALPDGRGDTADGEAPTGIAPTALTAFALLLFTASWALRRAHDGLASPFALGLSFAAAALALLAMACGSAQADAPSGPAAAAAGGAAPASFDGPPAAGTR